MADPSALARQAASKGGGISDGDIVKLGIEKIAVKRHEDISLRRVHQRDEIVVAWVAHS